MDDPPIGAGLGAARPPLMPVGPYVGHLGKEYWQEVKRWLPFLGLAIPASRASLVSALYPKEASAISGDITPHLAPQYRNAIRPAGTEPLGPYVRPEPDPFGNYYIPDNWNRTNLKP